MYATVIYKETLSPINGETLKIEVMEVEARESDAKRYAKLYGLQLPYDLKNKVIFRPIMVKVN